MKTNHKCTNITYTIFCYKSQKVQEEYLEYMNIQNQQVWADSRKVHSLVIRRIHFKTKPLTVFQEINLFVLSFDFY